jgi:ubiquinone/menaquinone biosynthesis C-methylase UbiE
MPPANQRDPRRDGWRDADFRRLGAFVAQYYARPRVDLARDYTSFRDDTVIRKVADLISAYDTVNVLDVCCGTATVAAWLADSIGNSCADRVRYHGVDEDKASIDEAVQKRLERKFKDFNLTLREAHELSALTGPFNLIVLINALHEVQPHKLPAVLAQFHEHLVEGGQVCLVDMESLPLDAEESIAIPWSHDEVA